MFILALHGKAIPQSAPDGLQHGCSRPGGGGGSLCESICRVGRLAGVVETLRVVP
jgi:hypothetical protein